MAQTIIAVDFDGTLAYHVFPEIGDPVPGAFEWLKRFKMAGAYLILYTVRGNERGPKSLEMFPDNRNFLIEAIEFCREQGVEFDAINHNPTNTQWTSSPKPYAHLYIDDAAFGCPLDFRGAHPCVDWSVVGPAVINLIEVRRIIE